MTRKIREYHRPAAAAEAAALLGRAEVQTALLVAGARVADEPLAGVEAVVDLGLLGLDRIHASDEGQIHLGGAATLQAVADSLLVQSLAGGLLAEAALLAAGSAQRNAATIGGSLLYARQALAADRRDGPPEVVLALLVLDAEVVVHDAPTRRLGDYLVGWCRRHWSAARSALCQARGWCPWCAGACGAHPARSGDRGGRRTR